EKRPENDMTGNLVMVKPTGTWAPLIFAHGGKASKYLLEFLPQQQPLWNFVSLGSDGERIAYKTVEEMASTYVRQLREREYKKPCILAGHSFGGLIAYEMASLLLQEHVPVKMLFMIDTHHPQYYYAPLKPKTFSQGLETYLIKYPNRMIRSICRLCASGITAMYHARARAVPSWLRSYYVVNVFNYKCSKKYVPKPLSCAVTFFEAQDYRNLPSSKGWRPLITGSFDVQSIVGDHLSIIHNQEQFRTIAQTMANVLASLHP
ncbi:MAG: hypothetical protein JW795_19400, partial [Chitinivibrionales bacterium]|nr:hypothetical protein [Chitinivibrionales bacterium]